MLISTKQRKKILEEFIIKLNWHTLEDLEDLANFEEALGLLLSKKNLKSIKSEAVSVVEQHRWK
jgi:hypothetical protein